MLRLQTEGSVTYGAKSMYMMAMAMVAMLIMLHTKAVFMVSATIFESMQQVMFFKKGECTEDAAAIHLGQHILYIGQ